jgi:hypothetical protein
MSIEFKDRVSTYPNRYLVTLENGTNYYAILERADEPTNPGTPLNASTLNQLVAQNDLAVLPNTHLWKKYAGDPSTYLTEEVEDVTLSSKTGLGDFSRVSYGDSFHLNDGMLFVDGTRVIISNPTTDKLTSTRGKYILDSNTTVYYIPEDATFTQTSKSQYAVTYYYLKVDRATKYSIPQYYGFVMDAAKNKYPTNGVLADDGYWYVYGHQWGECAGSVSAEEISAAVNDYLDEHPVTGGLTMSEVNAAIDAKIGIAIGGSY